MNLAILFGTHETIYNQINVPNNIRKRMFVFCLAYVMLLDVFAAHPLTPSFACLMIYTMCLK